MLLFFDILMILAQSEQNLTGFLQTVKIRGVGRMVRRRQEHIRDGGHAFALGKLATARRRAERRAPSVGGFPRPALHVCAPASGCVLAALEKKNGVLKTPGGRF